MILTIQMAWPWRCCYSHRDVVSLGISQLLSLISAWALKRDKQSGQPLLSNCVLCCREQQDARQRA